MSDFVPRDILPELWDEIVKRHWEYLDTEESIVKLEKRKKLEDCLKEFLCIVQHDRKFFLPDTAKVLKNSIRDLEDFSAATAITAFESISQYANNLFTKPWRKEFRILKMYSGFYQHEIKSNLLDAEKLFEAMGYRRLSDDTLILDGPICPDQVTNVSRDAMTAYVELQIIKHIYTGLDAIGINCSWLDIYRYREKYTGGTSQAVKALAYSIEEKRLRSRQKALAGDNYGYIDVQPSSNYFASPNTQFCPAQCQCNLYQQIPSVSRHRLNGMCCVPEHHPQSAKTTPNLVYSNMAYPAQHHYQHNHHHGEILNDSSGVPLSQMSHSRSLEHYSEPANHHHNILPHRHSFDHQQQGCTAQHHHSQQQQHHYYQHLNQPQQNFYESPYDCIDGNSMGGGSSTISYAAVAANAVTGASTTGSGSGVINCNLNTNSSYSHPYNVSGNRIPLPLNISNQLSAYDNLQSSNYVVSQEPTYAHIADQHMYSVSKLPQNCMMNSNAASYNQLSHVHGVQNPSLTKDSLQRQRSHLSEQLINFEDPSILPPNTPQQQFDPLNQYRPSYEASNHIMDKRYNMSNIMESSLPPPPVTSTCQQHYVAGKPAINDDMYVYAKPTPRENRKPLQNPINIRTSSYNSGDRGDTTDMSYESANDDFTNLPGQENERSKLRSPTQFTKNQDGVGSFESWNYVFKNLERSGYTKDLGEREDFLVQSLDLDSININNDTSPSQSSSAEKRRSNYAGNDIKTTSQHQQQSQPQPQHQPQQLEPKQKSRTFENPKYSSRNNTKMEITASASSSINSMQKPKTSMDNNTKKIKSALKQTNETSKPNTNNINPNHHTNKTQPKPNDNKTPPKTMNNNNNDSSTNMGNGTTHRKKSSSSATGTMNATRKSTSVGSTIAPPLSTQIIVTSPPEWSCSFCTFLNPNTIRICEMCCRSKDFNLDSSTTTTAAGGTTVAHNTPTCA